MAHCSAVTANTCEAPAGIAIGMGSASLPGVKRSALLTCGYCGEPVCSQCSDMMTPPAFFDDQSPVPVCETHNDNEIAQWLGVT